MGLSIVERVKTVALPMGPLTNFGYYTPKAVRSRQSFAMYLASRRKDTHKPTGVTLVIIRARCLYPKFARFICPNSPTIFFTEECSTVADTHSFIETNRWQLPPIDLS